MKCNQNNEIILYEQENPPRGCTVSMEHIGSNPMNELNSTCVVQLVPNHVINGSVPLNVISKNIENQKFLKRQRPTHEYPKWI